MGKRRRITWGLYRRLLGYIRPYYPLIALGMVFALICSATEGATALIVKPIMDDIFIRKDVALLKVLPWVLVFLYVVKGGARFGQSYLMRSVGQRVVMRFRYELYHHIQRLSLSYFHRVPSAVLMSRITNDVKQLSRISAEIIADFFRQVFTMLVLLGVIFYQEWRMALIYFSVLPGVMWPIRAIGRRLRQISRWNQEKMAELNVILQETFTGNKIVKAFNMEEYEAQRFQQENEKLYRLQMKGVAANEILSPLMECLGAIGTALVIWYGGMRVIQGTTTPGTFFSFIAAVAMLYRPVRKLGKMHNVFQEAMAATERVFEVLDTEPDVKDRPGAVRFPGLRECIEFRRVYFQYDGSEAVLKNINLRIDRGQTVALVGLSGAGKSTLVDLIPRFYDVSSGAIFIDGVDVRDIQLRSLREKIGIVTQETILFNDTVANNIAYGRRDASRKEIEEAARLAYAHQFIVELPEGYDTVIGERGAKLSGGQRKRLAIARALLKNPDILILDEATAELDSESEELVQQALQNLMAGRTTIAIAHRLSTIYQADKIVVIDNGQIVQTGRHEELIKQEGIYRRLYNLQFKAQERPKEE